LGIDKRILEYPLFQAGGRPVFELTNKQARTLEQYFQRLMSEVNSDYVHRYDLAKVIVAEIMHFTMKLEQFKTAFINKKSASERLAVQFLELLERQFPIETEGDMLKLRNAGDFARQLNVHVNHLNRAIKNVTKKTTTQVIQERILLEAKILLKHTVWNIAEIAYCLNFREPSHFNSFFKKFTQLTPVKYRIQ
jgi:AraC-like DNA-binding protein